MRRSCCFNLPCAYADPHAVHHVCSFPSKTGNITTSVLVTLERVTVCTVMMVVMTIEHGLVSELRCSCIKEATWGPHLQSVCGGVLVDRKVVPSSICNPMHSCA